MGIKEKMMESMMNNMGKEEKQQLMEKMMEKFLADMTPEEKQGMMSNMMKKMAGDSGSGMPPMMGMMKMMMGRMAGPNQPNTGDGPEDHFSPMDMCRQMMEKIGRGNEIAEFATPELRGLFEEWSRQLEEEIAGFVQEKKSTTPTDVSEKFKLSKESAIYILSKLARQGELSLTVRSV